MFKERLCNLINKRINNVSVDGVLWKHGGRSYDPYLVGQRDKIDS